MSDVPTEESSTNPSIQQPSRTHPLTAMTRAGVFAGAGLVAGLHQLKNAHSMSRIALMVGGFVLAGLFLGLLAGWVRWLFTRYRIDAEELRIDTGPIINRSRRVPFERLQSVDIAQPLVARILGLAELRMEVAGGHDTRTILRYLAMSDAQSLRHVLLERAHGVAAENYSPDAAEERSVIVAVPVQHILVGTVLSLDFLGLALATVASVFLIAVGQFWAVGVLVAAGPSLLQLVTRRVLAEGNFTLSRGSRGLRIERGLLSTSSQTIPAARVQGVDVDEPFLWRRFGWLRLRVDVAGYGAGDGHKDEGVDDSTLLPIGPVSAGWAITDELVPGSPPDHVARRFSPPGRSWWFAPVGWQFRWTGASETAVVSRTGWVRRHTNVSPHHKVQSLTLRQGPLQRLVEVATVRIHTTPGPVTISAEHLTPTDARSLLDEQSQRSFH